MLKNREKIEPRVEQPKEIPPETKERREVSEQDFLQEYERAVDQTRPLADIQRQMVELRARLQDITGEQKGPRPEEERQLTTLIDEIDSVMSGHYRDMVALLSREQYRARTRELEQKLGTKELASLPPDTFGRVPPKNEREAQTARRMTEIELVALKSREQTYAQVNQKLQEVGRKMRDQERAGGVSGPEYDEATALLSKYSTESAELSYGPGLTYEERSTRLAELAEKLSSEAGAISERAPKAPRLKAHTRRAFELFIQPLTDTARELVDAYRTKR